MKDEFFTKFKNLSTKAPSKADLRDRLITEELERLTADINDWRNAVEAAEDTINPDREELLVLYKDIVDDYQVTSGMGTRINMAISGTFQIIDENGEEDEEEQRKFLDPKGNPLPWFRDLMRIIELSKFYGYEVANMISVEDNIYKEVYQIPEQNLVPIFRSILKDSRTGITQDNMIPITEDPQWTWLIEAGSTTDLGLLNKIAPLYIYKKVLGAWNQHANIFGMPLRIGRTDLRDKERRQNMIQWMEEMGKASYGIFDPEDQVEFIEQKGSNDPYKIYDALINKCDAGISKIILHQTGTTDEKAFAGSAGVHQDILGQLIKSDQLDIAAIINDQLIPKMKKVGMISSSKKIMGVWDWTEQNSNLVTSEIILNLSKAGHKTTTEEVKKRLGMDTEEIETPEPSTQVPDNKFTSVMGEVQNFYKEKINGND